MSDRATRITDLAQRGFDRDRAAGVLSIEAAVRQIEATFGHNRVINDRKLAVENAMCVGPSVSVRQAYGHIAFLIPAFAYPGDIDGALQAVEREYRAEQRNHRTRVKNALPLKHPRVEHRLQEARIFLRWYRRYGDREMFAGIVEAMTVSASYLVAAE